MGYLVKYYALLKAVYSNFQLLSLRSFQNFLQVLCSYKFAIAIVLNHVLDVSFRQTFLTLRRVCLSLTRMQPHIM